MLWEAIKSCAREGCRSFSLGRTDLDNEGLLTFKNGWGGNRTVLNYYRYDFASNSFVCGRERNVDAYRELLRKLPIGLLKDARHLGLPAYRLIPEVLAPLPDFRPHLQEIAEYFRCWTLREQSDKN